MNDRPLVSIVIPTYNHGAFLAEAIDSALAQKYAPVEICVVDDGSTDQTAELLRRYAGRVVAVRQGHQGPGAARNAGLRRSSGRFVLFLDADDVLVPDAVEQLVRLMQIEPSLVMAFGWCEKFDSATGRTLKTPRNWRRRIDAIPYRSAGPHGRVFQRCISPDLIEGSFIPTGTALCRRDALQQLGGFRAELGSTAEDLDMWLRLARLGAVGFVEKVLLKVRVHPQRIQNPPDMIARLSNLADFTRQLMRHAPTSVERRLARKCLNKRLFELGWWQFDAGRLSEARRSLLESYLLRPTDLRSIMYCFAACLPANMIRRMKNRRRRAPQPVNENNRQEMP